jgi:hypothetical protein
MAQYAKEEEANEAAARAMKERVERQKQQIAEAKVCSAVIDQFLFHVLTR